MIKPNIEYLAFDDRKLILIGVPTVTLFLPLLFFGLSLEEYAQVFHQEFFEVLVFSTVFWLFSRQTSIWLRKRYRSLEEIWKRLGIQLLISIILLPIISAIISLTMMQAYRLTGKEDLCDPTFLQAMAATYFLTFAIVTLYEAIYFFHSYKQAILEKEQIQRAHIQSQLDNLKNQINPHFLFNSLNTLMNLIPTDSNRAMNYLSKLSKFYRYTVSNQEAPLVLLEEELKNVKIYAALLQERFHQGIEIEMPTNVPFDVQIIPLCLQLLIENAVKHNIVSKKRPLHIEISMIDEGQYIQVKNNIQKKIQAVSSTGKGLKNIKKRVAYFTKSPLVIKDDGDQFTVAVPLIKKTVLHENPNY